MDSARIRRGFAATVATAALVGSALLASTTAASAATTNDPRALAFDGNVKTCEAAGLSGDLIDKADLDFVISSDGIHLTILAENNGAFVTGIVVKGGPGYNVYEPGMRGLSWAPPWEDLESPLNRGGNVPQVSHWFACGEYNPDEGS